jgi:hypothetical protein
LSDGVVERRNHASVKSRFMAKVKKEKMGFAQADRKRPNGSVEKFPKSRRAISHLPATDQTFEDTDWQSFHHLIPVGLN